MTEQLPRYEPRKPEAYDSPSNMPLLLIASGFLCVTIVMVLLQPGLAKAPTRIAAAHDQLLDQASDVRFATSQTVVAQGEDVVTRSGSQVFSTPQSPSTAEAITRELLDPVRQASTSRKLDLPRLAQQTVIRFDIKGEAALGVYEDLNNQLVSLILRRLPDAEVVAILNSGAQSGKFRIPAALLTTTRQMDGPALLAANLEAASGYRAAPQIPVSRYTRYIVNPGDSVAGLALKFYGSPFEFREILEANPKISASTPVLRPGSELTIPPM